MIEVRIIRLPDPAYPHRYTHRLIVPSACGRSGWCELRLNTPGQWRAELARHTDAAAAAAEVGDDDTAHYHHQIAGWLATHTPKER